MNKGGGERERGKLKKYGNLDLTFKEQKWSIITLLMSGIVVTSYRLDGVVFKSCPR
jgi:hypothetical protein